MKFLTYCVLTVIWIIGCAEDKKTIVPYAESINTASLSFYYPTKVNEITVDKIVLVYWKSGDTITTADCKDVKASNVTDQINEEIKCRVKDELYTKLESKASGLFSQIYEKNQSLVFRFYLIGTKESKEVLIAKTTPQYVNCNDIESKLEKSQEKYNVSTCIVDFSTNTTTATTIKSDSSAATANTDDTCQTSGDTSGASSTTTNSGTIQNNSHWVTAYTNGYRQSNGEFKFLSEDDWKTITHAIHMGATLNGDGSISFADNGVEENNRKRAIEEAHKRNTPIMFNILSGGYRAVVDNPASRTKLVTSLVDVFKEGYDGLDIDLEPITSWGQEAGGNPGLVAFLKELHTELQKYKTPLLDKPLLTMASDSRSAGVLKEIQSIMDQINLMTYDLVGPSVGHTWADSAISGGGFASLDKNPFTLTKIFENMASNGVDLKKLAVGVNLEAREWKGGSGTECGGMCEPKQPMQGIVGHVFNGGVGRPSYTDLYNTLINKDNCIRKWDADAQMPYLRCDRSSDSEDMYVSYNDEESTKAKVKFMKDKGIGGIMIWEGSLGVINGKNVIIEAIRNELGVKN